MLLLLHTVQWEQSSPSYDESVFRLNPTLKVVWWNGKRAEQLILQLAASIPQLAQTFYALSDRAKEQQELVALAILYEHGGLYVRSDAVAQTEFPQSRSFLVSAKDGQWAVAPEARDARLFSVLKEYAKTVGKGESAWEMARKKEVSKSTEKEEKSFSFPNSEKSGTLLDSIGEKVKEATVKTSIWTQIALGVGALLLVAAIVFGLWRFLEPNKIASTAFEKAQRWVQERLKGWDETIASSAAEILHKIVKKQ